MSRQPGPWALRAWLSLCLLAWPTQARRRDGRAVVRAVRDQLAEVPGLRGALTIALPEGLSIVVTGLGLRLRSVGLLLAGAAGAARDLRRDLGFSVRSARRAPGFTAAAVATLAVGIGASASVLELSERVLLTPPPYHEPERLALVWNTWGPERSRMRIAAPDVAVVRERARSLDAVAFVNRVRDGALDATDGQGAHHVTIAAATANLAEVLGVSAALGRTLAPTDAAPLDDRGGPLPDVAVLSHGLWHDVFGADPGVLGRSVLLDGRRVTVVGVMSADFELLLPPDAGIETAVDVWTPLRVPLASYDRGDGRLMDQDTDNTGVAIARLSPGATLGDAARELARITAELRREVPHYAAAELGLEARPLHADATAHARPVLSALTAGALLVLLAMCLNVSVLLLARGLSRRRELELRAALGASRGRVGRQLVAEVALLVAAGALGGLVVAQVASAWLAPLAPEAIRGASGVSGGLRALGLATVLAAAFSLSAGVGPALARRRRARPGRFRAGLVVAEVALSVVLVLGAGLLYRSVAELRRVEPGFGVDGRLAFQLSLRQMDRYRGPGERARLVRAIEERLRDVPGVRAVGATGVLPLAGDRWVQPYGLPGQPPDAWIENRADFRVVTSGYFEAVGTRLLEGRAFTRDEDLSERRRVAVVDGKLARLIAPAGGSAVGAAIGIPLDGAAVEAEVVGVVEHTRHDDLKREGREAVYVPYRQEASREIGFVVLADGDPAALAPAVRRALAAVDPGLPPYGLETMAARVDTHTAPLRFALELLVAFAAAGLIASALGLYGVVSFEMGRRRRDIGIRLAVGATRTAAVSGVLGGGLRLTIVGLAAGALASVGLARALRGVVFEVSVADPVAWAAALLGVMLVAGLACWVPTRRASRLDPSLALRAVD